LRTNNFDPLAYIESGFRDTESEPKPEASTVTDFELSLPSISDYLSSAVPRALTQDPTPVEPQPKARFRKTVMSAPRPRRAKDHQADQDIDPELHSIWTALPKNVEFLCSFFDDTVTKNYYRGEFKESRRDLVRRLLDPELSLEETARLLGVCPATVRRYTNRGWLAHHRTVGGQRRFRLSDIVRFVDEHGRMPEA
jgi:excisionase family DNA binding protein